LFVLGAVRVRVDRIDKGHGAATNNLAAMAASLGGVVVYTVIFFVGSTIVDYLQPQPSGAATIVYWVFAAFSVAYILNQLPAKVKNGWRDATQEDAMLRRAFENAKNFPPKRSPASSE
jgi:uncharacterized membrane protein YbhN (UPF0104 family)